MKTVGSYEAKTHLPQLLDRVERGERIVITKRGKPIAVLVPADTFQTQANPANIVQDMLHQRDMHGPRLGKGVSIRDLVEKGHRF